MSLYKVIVTDYFFPNLDLEKEELAKIDAELEVLNYDSEETMLTQLQQADAVLNCFASISEQMIDAMNQCKIIARYGIGVDTIPIEHASEKGIMVTNVPDYCVDEVSDHALALIMACARKIVPLHQDVHKGNWDYRSFRPILRLRGKVLGLIGFGKIPRILAAKAAALGMDIKAYDPYVSEKIANEHGVELLDLEGVLQQADFVSVHTPLTKDTYHLIGRNELSKMKSNAFIINTSRGGIIDEDALALLLKKGVIGGAALDVIEDEKEVHKSKVWRADNCILTPHTAFYSEESILELQQKTVQQVVAALTGEKPVYLIN